MAELKVTQTKSKIGGKQDAARLAALARPAPHRRRRSSRQDRPEIRGMIQAVRHLVTVEEVD